MGATIRDIAEKTGVSITTISQILNGKGSRFSEATRNKVFQTAKELAYKPNFFAKNMVTNRTNTIGMIVPEVTDPFFSQMVKGAEDYLNAHDYMILLCNSSQDSTREDLYVEELLHRAVDGLIIASPNILASNVFTQLESMRKPYILLDRKRHHREEGNIYIDDYEGGYMATEHLVSLGHRKIGIITSDDSFYSVEERLQGYQACLKKHHLPISPDWIMEGDQTMAGGYNATKKLLAATDITALFVTNDQMAVGAYRAALELGITIPDDLSIVGFDDIELAEYMAPTLTTVRQPIYAIGQTAADYLLKAIQNPNEKMANQKMPLELIVRESARKLADKATHK
ncbi:LacI family DNA-binding transcriptional regulator [Listeria booriae]|uniref:LacI family transcriptional regulator n=1 Tax=Listeria booriae TaxID=1552123 RepID=A0A7X0XUW0_9LIST|nr:substrate-binding domain-containing protein [Listeria booriae]MBC1559400.1 LacI family transcriptional regulator [Listeria booriae]MBC1792210.1 LacI family transcriptional regulator [Listeria booriae]MBC1975484.1 LacI family transcriptional regulator [Listeria booriae]MBC1984909.1 LacI family transcriptional regulator [Listeria booriae]MBC2023928.1 LacI family transcriptional regulator [Listeria booriae]